ncbi:Mammalian uncoordinated homology 13, domain 2 [Artemisia annua]|uniref:Mammalian uncoordinated homology 13, domain 2 n=1 Tax=Artemisia annua TaxID=35608 RepID=A0A2U1LLK2_ARTAN|nr:Mammalian uncoordinated homology 13, domain 2 [Artemisia annua]
MASLFSRERLLGQSTRSSLTSTTTTTTTPAVTLSPLPSPFGDLTPSLSQTDLRDTAYEIFIATCRTSTGKPLSFTSNTTTTTPDKSSSSSPGLNGSPSSRSMTSAAASKMKKAFGLRSSSSLGLGGSPGSGGSGVSNGGGSGGKVKKVMTVGELVRVQMKVSDSDDSRVRRALLRISAGQVGRKVESMVLPLELLQQFKSSDFTDQQEYDKWQKRNLKMLEAGLLIHPHVPLGKATTASQRLQKIIHNALEKPIETGRNNETMQVLRGAVMSLANRSTDGSLDSCHWADGFPLNLRLYEILLETCFDSNDESSIIDEVDEVMELIKKTWGILGINQMLHNICFTWVLFNRFVATGQIDNDLLYAADCQLVEVAKDAKTTKDPTYAKILNSTLTAILGWSEQRLLAYHDTFDKGNINSMQSIVSLGVSAAKVLVEDISNEYRRRRKNEVDVARSRTDTYIRSSLRTAFAQIMEKADSSRRASRNQPNPLPVLAILAKDVGELATKEKKMFSPILKRWHPLAAGVAVATLHVCYGNELKQFILGITELTPEAVQVLRAADKLEQDLVQIAVEDSVDSDDGGKAIIREMPPFEAEVAIANLVKSWTKLRLDRLKEWIDRNLQQEVWNPRANQEGYAPSAVEVLRIIDETLDAFFQLPIPTHPALLPDLIVGLDRCLQYYTSKAKSGCGSRNTFIPAMPALTRCAAETKFHGVFKKKEKPANLQRRNSQVSTTNGNNNAFGVPQLCVRINTLQQIRTELEVLEKRIITLLRNSESAHVSDFSNGLAKKFELTPGACLEGIQQLCESTAYKIVFHDLSHSLWDGLYVGELSSSAIEPFLQDLEQNLMVIADTVNERVRTRLVAEIMKASFEGFLLVLLAGGPSRAFTLQDSQQIEDDFKSLKDLFWANGDGLPMDVINKFSATARDMLPLFRTETETVIERFRRATLETYGSSAKSRLPLPATTGQWSPSDPNTLLRVLCYRNDDAASRFLKKTYNLPKKL